MSLFFDELADQWSLAESQLRQALDEGDEAAADLARVRLRDLADVESSSAGPVHLG